jgi:hypothetical protein
MAKTSKQILTIKEPMNLTAFPVASGETIYSGTLAAVVGGYLYNMDSAAAQGASIVGFVADDTAIATGEAATTANGSISGSAEEGSGIAGDKTVRQIYLSGQVRVTGSGFAQTSVGKVAYATDNFTFNITGGNAAAKVGTVSTYISATTVYVDLNKYYNANGLIEALVPLTAATTTAGGDVVNWTAGRAIYVMDVIIDVTTDATGTPTLDVGYAATGTTSDLFIDGLAIGTGTPFTTATKQLIAATGDAAGAAKLTAAQFVTATPSASAAGLVGTMRILYLVA